MMKYPHVQNINPNIIENSLKENLENCFNNLQQIVNFGAHLFKWHIEKVEGTDEKLATILFIRNIIEIVDSISILIKNSSIDQCKILLRTLIESYFSFEYLLTNETDKRSMAFLAWRLNKDVEYYRKFESNSKDNIELKEEIKKNNEFWEKFINLDKPEMTKRISEIENTLNNNLLYFEANKEYHRTKHKEWYNMYNGPKNFFELSKDLNQNSIYKIFYTYLSDSAHGSDILRGIIEIDYNGTTRVNQIRLGKNYQEMTLNTIIISLLAFDCFIKTVLPEKEELFREWIKDEIEQFF